MSKQNNQAKATEEVKVVEETKDAEAVVFPTLVYRCPGTHQCPGGTFNSMQVHDYDNLVVALKDGWSETLPDAMGK